VPLNLGQAQTIIAAALAHARAAKMRSLTVVVLDARGAVTGAASEDGSALRRFEIARGKANGALSFNVGSRRLGEMAKDIPHFFAGAANLVGGVVPVAGGVLIKDAAGVVTGAVGISGDNSDNDEAAAIAGIRAAGLTPDGG
jgi:uncharacterized protein GlcG (DUF336 family)